MIHYLTYLGDRVLIFEEDEGVANRLALLFSRLRFKHIHVVTSADQARRIVGDCQIDFGVLGLDLKCVQKTVQFGSELTDAGIPVIFQSGLSTQNVSLLAQGFEHLERPISLPRLKAAVHRAMLRNVALISSNNLTKKMADQKVCQ